MGKKLLRLVFAVLVLLPVYAKATVYEWTSGTYEIVSSNNYSMDWINLRNSAVVNMTGGNLGVLYAYDTSEFNFQGGHIGSTLQFYGTSTVNISSGTINGGFNMYGNSVINITGGILPGFDLVGSSTVANLWGGQISGIYSQGIVNIYGKNIVIESYNTDSKRISGFWKDGTAFSFIAWRAVPYNSQFVIHEIPEPATVSLLLMGIVAVRKIRG